LDRAEYDIRPPKWSMDISGEVSRVSHVLHVLHVLLEALRLSNLLQAFDALDAPRLGCRRISYIKATCRVELADYA
jgi:hypothetical protein